MALSTLSASPGLLWGYRSASIDLSRAVGASGNWPSTAWLPITTISRSPAMRPAARIRCSSSERFIHAPPLGAREHACERRRLPQAGGRFVSGRDQRGDLGPGAIEVPAPLVEGARRVPAVARDPFCEIAPRRGEQPPVGFDLARDQAVHREAARLDDAVLQQAGRDRRGRCGLPARRHAQARRAPARAVAAHALGGGLGAAGGRASAAAAKIAHRNIVTCYYNSHKPAFFGVIYRAWR